MQHTLKNEKIYNNDKPNIEMSILLGALIVYEPIMNAVNTFTNLYYPNTPYDTLVGLIIIAVLMAKAAPKIFKNYNFIIISLWVFMLLCLFSTFVYPNNQSQIVYYIKNYFFIVFPYLFLGFALDDYEKLYKYLKILVPLALGSVILDYAIKLLTAQKLYSDNMSYAYMILPCLIVSLYFTFKNWKSFYLILSVIGSLLLVGTGTRGPIICLISYIIIYTLTHLKSVNAAVITILSLVALMVFTVGGYMVTFFIWISRIFTKLGIPTRIFDYFLKNNYFNTTGRDPLFNTVKDAIYKRPIEGYGIFGDRSLLGGSNTIYKGRLGEYVHNILLEFICQFGVVVGIILLIWLAATIIRAYIIEKDKFKREFILIVLPMAIIKLFMSNSYLQEPFFFLLLGACIKIILTSQRETGSRALMKKKRSV